MKPVTILLLTTPLAKAHLAQKPLKDIIRILNLEDTANPEHHDVAPNNQGDHHLTPHNHHVKVSHYDTKVTVVETTDGADVGTTLACYYGPEDTGCYEGKCWKKCGGDGKWCYTGAGGSEKKCSKDADCAASDPCHSACSC